MENILDQSPSTKINSNPRKKIDPFQMHGKMYKKQQATNKVLNTSEIGYSKIYQTLFICFFFLSIKL